MVLPFWLAIGHAEKGCGVVGVLEWGAWEDIMLLMYCAMPNCVLFLWTILRERTSVLLMGLSIHLGAKISSFTYHVCLVCCL